MPWHQPLDEKSALILRRTIETCDVFLCSRPLESGNSSCRNFMSSLSSSRSVCGDAWNKHWLVILHYGEDLVYICEAGADQTGTLKGSGYWQDWTIVKESRDSYRASTGCRHLGSFQIPKALAKKVVKEMGDSGKYHVTDNNCQKWAQELLRRLGVPVPEDLPDAQTVYEDAKPSAITLICGSLLIACFGIGCSIYRAHA
ncbi:hypothetical protein MTO96_017104 [Rhipicephalus appendiculatus]